jgi:YVTN family beta-propeller protein
LFALGLIVFSFKGFVYSKTDTGDTSESDIPVESNPRGIAINNETNIAVVANEKSDSVSIVDLNTQTVLSTVSVGKSPIGVAIDKDLNIALIGNSKDDSVSIIDLNIYEVTATIPVGKEPEGIAVDSSTNTAIVANHKDDTVSVIDLTTYTVTNTISVGQEPKDIAIDPELNIALVVNEKSTSQEIQNTAKMSFPQSVSGNPETKTLDARLKTPDNKFRGQASGMTEGFSGEKDYNVSVIDLNTYQVTDTVSVGKKPQAIDINPETHLAAVVNEKNNSITVIDLQTWQTNTISVGKHPIDVVINQLDNRALVICDEDRTLLLIDLTPLLIPPYQGGTEGGVTYSLEKLPKGVAVNNFTNIAAITDDSTDSITLIQLSNPVPEITLLNPSTVYRGSSGESITIEGNKFIKTSEVYFGSQLLETTFTDNHNLQIIIPKDLLSIAGTYQITITNPSTTDSDGGTTSASLQIDNPVPTISSLDPIETTAGEASLTLTIYGTGFFDDSSVYANGTSRTFTLLSQTKLQIELTSEDLEYGRYLEIKASNPKPGGGTSNSATFTVNNPVPSLSSISPSSTTAGSSDFTLTLTGSNFVKTSEIYFNNQQYSTTYKSSTQLETTIPANAVKTSGDYQVKVTNPSPGGGETSSLTFTVKPALEIKITSPTDGETINKSKTIVKGTYKADTKDIGITVNGVIAEIYGNEWVANNIALSTGTNTIEATATDSDENTASTSITVNTTDTDQKVELSANITSGISPLTTNFSVSTSGITPLTYSFDFDGDGKTDYISTSPDSISFYIDATDTVETHSSTAQINGTTEITDATIKINDATASITDGTFGSYTSLSEGSNEISINVTSSGEQITKHINVNATPTLQINAQDEVNTTSSTITIDGTSEKQGVTVEINGESVSLDSNGGFTKSIQLESSSTTITFKATDASGNQAEKSITVNYSTRGNNNYSKIAISPNDELYGVSREWTGSSYNSTIEKVASNGEVNTVIALSNYDISDIAFNQAGELFIVGYSYSAGNWNIFKLKDNNLETFVGKVDYAIYGMAFHPTSQLLYISSYYDIYTVNEGGSSTFFASLSSITRSISAIAFDQSGNLFALASNNKIIKISPEGRTSTFAQLSGYYIGMTTDLSGNIYVATGLYIKKITPDGNISTFATADLNKYGGFYSIATDSSSNLIVVTTNGNLLKIGQDGIVENYVQDTGSLNVKIKDGLNSTTENVSVTVKSSSTPISYTYQSEGIFYPTVTVTDDQGNIYSDTIAITVLSKTEMDNLLKGKWEGMKEELSNGDIEGAVEYLSEGSQEMYRYNFNLMQSVLSEIIGDFGNIQLIKITDDVAEYEMLATQDGTEFSFYVEFVKDSNGVWKLRFF